METTTMMLVSWGYLGIVISFMCHGKTPRPTWHWGPWSDGPWRKHPNRRSDPRDVPNRPIWMSGKLRGENETKRNESQKSRFNKSYDTRNKSFQQKIISKSHVSHVSWILLEMLGSSHECFLESFGFNSQLTCCFWHFVTQALGQQAHDWKTPKSTNHQPSRSFQHFHCFNTP